MNLGFRHALAGALALIAGVDGAYAQVSCLPIDRIDVRGVSLLTAAEISEVIAPFEGHCLGLPQINAALEAVTFSYVDKGYILARAYLPEQDIADRVLEISVVEGKLAAITFDGETRRAWQNVVFPGLVGRSANLREIEQGLDMIRSMPAFGAEMEINAGAAEGETVLDIATQSERPWTGRIGASNQGNPGAGQYLSTLDMTYDHLFGVNDSWAVSLSRGVETFPFSFNDGGAASHSIGLNARFPYGPWQLSGAYKFSQYRTDTLGPITTIGTDGWTHTLDLELTRILHRNQDSKTSVTARLERRENVNRIAEITIISSSRVLTTARLDLTHERTIWGGALDASVGVEQGLRFLGAEDANAQPAGQPDAQFTLLDFSLDYSRPWALESSTITYTGEISGQWGFDKLYGAQQFSLGGLSTLRGTNKSIVAGNSGILWRNELAWSPEITWPAIYGRLQLYGAVDLGYIRPEAANGVTGGEAIGSAIGIRTLGGTVSFDLGWHQVLRTPGGGALSAGILFASVSTQF